MHQRMNWKLKIKMHFSMQRSCSKKEAKEAFIGFLGIFVGDRWLELCDRRTTAFTHSLWALRLEELKQLESSPLITICKVRMILQGKFLFMRISIATNQPFYCVLDVLFFWIVNDWRKSQICFPWRQWWINQLINRRSTQACPKQPSTCSDLLLCSFILPVSIASPTFTADRSICSSSRTSLSNDRLAIFDWPRFCNNFVPSLFPDVTMNHTNAFDNFSMIMLS